MSNSAELWPCDLASGLLCRTVFYNRTTNYTGTITDALAQLIDVGATASVAAQPLAAANASLDAHPAFLRSTAALGIVIITASDDASSAPAADYASGLKARKTDPLEIAVDGVYWSGFRPAGTPPFAASAS